MTSKASAADKSADQFDPLVVDPKWVESLPEYVGPTKAHALQIQHIEKFGPDGAPRDKKGKKSGAHQSLASTPVSASAVPATERPQPEDYGEHAAARLTPVDKTYAPFEVDEAYMRDNRPHTGGFYVVYETGAEGFEAPEVFTQKYTRVEKPEEVAAKEKHASQLAEQAAKTADDELTAAEKAGNPQAIDQAREKAKNAKAAVKSAPKAAASKGARKK